MMDSIEGPTSLGPTSLDITPCVLTLTGQGFDVADFE